MNKSNPKSKINYMEKHYFKRDDFSDLKEMIYTVGKKYAGKTAFKLKDNAGQIYNVSYFEFLKDVESLGTALISYGLKDKFIAVVGKNSYKWAVSYLAACIVGVVVPIDKELKVNDMITFLNDSNSSVILGDSRYLEEIKANDNLLNNQNLIYIDFNKESSNTDNVLSFNHFKTTGQYNKETSYDTSFENIKINPDEMHFLLFTSGTTGNSKGVCLSHRNICSNIFSIGSIVKVDTHTEIMSILPIHHTYECTLGFLLVISSGGTISYLESYKHLPQNLNEYKPNIFLSVPLILDKLHANILKTLKNSLPKKYFENNPQKHIMDNLPLFLFPTKLIFFLLSLTK